MRQSLEERPGFRMNKKAFVTDAMTVIIWSLALIVIVFLVYIGGIVFPVLVPVSQDALTTINDAMQSTGDPNIQNASQASFVPLNRSLDNGEWMAYTLMIFSFMAFLVMCFYVRTYPFLLWIWIIMMIVVVFCSIILTVSYQDIKEDPKLASYYDDWGNVDFGLRNLPLITFILGVGGGIIMFMLVSRDAAAEQGGAPL